MNIEERLQALSAETKSLPAQMNTERITRRVKRRKMVRDIGIIGKIAAALFIVFTVSIGIGVNSSVVFAKTVTEFPIIGSYSQLLIVRPEIKKALNEHDDLEEPINNGRLHEVSISVPGKNSPITLTLDSFLADEIALTGFFKLEGITDTDGYYALGKMRITDLRSGEQLTVIEELRPFDSDGDLYMNRYFWNHPAMNIALDFDLEIVSDDYTHRSVIETYHIELQNIDINPALHIPLDETALVEGHAVHLDELLVSENGTVITYDQPEDFQLSVLNLEITDPTGEMVVSRSLPGICEFEENGVMHHILSSFYYQDIDTVKIQVISAYCSFFYDEYVRIDPASQTATFHGENIPIRAYSSHASYADFGLPKNDYLDSIDTMLFLIPSENIPDLTSAYFPVTNEMSYVGSYPHVAIDDTEYLVIQCPTYFVNDADQYYYFIQGTEPTTYPVENSYEVTIPSHG
ncbi:MAG: DUF4179 domain-containing protein [Clostridiales bacterium]|nr:DUF4179 domain-containing protein [Clostridiales bacterium]